MASLLVPWGPGLLRGLVAGVVATSYFWMVFMVALLQTYPTTVGEWGESFTRELLKGRGFDWPIVDDVPLERRNVDHVAVSPSAILAIETKFIGAGRHWETDSYRESAMQGARSSARSVSLILRSRGMVGLPVQPVLMLWGPAAPKLPGGWTEVDGVHVVSGSNPEAWRQRCRRGAINDDQAAAITQKLIEHRDMRDAYDRRK
ncbi:NERD domain-containing protein [Knoellia locipacati]|uniref:nuclease-related domain-containing protein n=1 Tax=Knoellia locipacati TaxID=882824 RepID=UPI00384B9D5C